VEEPQVGTGAEKNPVVAIVDQIVMNVGIARKRTEVIVTGGGSAVHARTVIATGDVTARGAGIGESETRAETGVKKGDKVAGHNL